MKKIFTTFFFMGFLACFQAQWSPTTFNDSESRKDGQVRSYYTLDIASLRLQLEKAHEAGKNAKPVTISLPTLNGKIERFAVYSFPVVVKELAEQYKLGSYVGVGIDDSSKYLRFSLAPNDFQSMIFTKDGYEFIEPANSNKTIYEVHPKTQGSKKGFVCSTEESISKKKEIEKLFYKGQSFQNQPNDFAKSSDRRYRTLRLAMSVTGEYTQFHGGTVAGALAAINATLTRVNGVYEKDLALHLILQNFPNIIYTDPNTDPYSDATVGANPANAGNSNGWSLQLQNTLTTNVGNANYDIGHVFGASGGGGYAGCLGCICLDPGNPAPSTGNGKGSAYTSPLNGPPQGDTFDIDFVSHEMGHQLGGYHTFTFQNQGNQAQMEPASGSTIMAYAGIVSGANVQQNSDAYFFKKNIDDIQVNLAQKTCDIETIITNNPPVIASLPTYTIPKGTAFVLTASATDAENDPMTYTWEQADLMTVPITGANLGTTTTGPSFRSLMPTTSPTRYFPKLSSVLAGVLNNSNNLWEAVSTVARTSKFAITVRDNNPVAAQQQTQTAVQTINVGNDGPFQVNATTIYNNTPSTITWDVANTSTAPYNTANVKVDFTTDNGATWNVVSASTPNDGTELLDFSSFPLTVGGTAKIRVSAINNVFYAVGNASIATMPPCTSNPPTGVQVTALTQLTATITWNPALNATYVAQYRVAGTPSWTTVTPAPTTNTVTLTGLTPGAQYEFRVANVCSGVTGNFSVIIMFTTSDCSTTLVPPAINITNITTNSALITWNPAIVGALYTMRWRKTGITTWPNPDISLPVAPANTYTLSGLDPYTSYEVQIASKCAAETTWRPYSNSIIFTTERTCELPPPGLTITQLLPTSAQIQWDPYPGATYILKYRKVGIPSWTDISVSTNNYLLTGLMELTKYEMQVANICNGTPGAFTPLYYFTTPTVTHCKMGAGSSASEYISKVTVKPNGKPVKENVSGASTYTDYSGVQSKIIELIQGSTDNEIIIEKKWTGTTYKEGVAVWIDFNRNGAFDINERVLVSSPSTTTPVSGKFNVPVDAFVSMTDHKYVIMRVAMQRDGIPVTCLDFGNGEVEDYAVRITRKAVPNPVDQTGILIYPNPASSILYVKNISKKAKYKIYNAAGQVVADGILLNNQVNVSKLINGVYVLDLDDNGNTAQKKFIKEQ